MVNSMGLGRLIDSSIFYFIKDFCLINMGWYHNVENVILNAIPGSSNIKYTADTIENWIYFNPDIYRLTDLIISPVVKIDGNIEPNTNYIINYRNGIVEFNSAVPQGLEVTADFSYGIFTVTDEDPDPTSPDFKLSTIGIEYEQGKDTPFELGGADKTTRRYSLQIYAKNKGERDGVCEDIKNYLKRNCPLWDFDVGFPILYNGDVNNLFNFSDNVIGRIEFDNTVWNNIRLSMAVEAEKYRAIITFYPSLINKII